jgi:rubrerythrin
MPVGNLLVCEECFSKLKEEQELRLKGIEKCQNCGNLHRTIERCPICGAPY